MFKTSTHLTHMIRKLERENRRFITRNCDKYYCISCPHYHECIDIYNAVLALRKATQSAKNSND